MPIQPEGQGAAASPFDAVLILLAQEGLNIKKALSVLSLTEASILLNAVPTLGGQLLTRPGQTSLATAVSGLHTIARLNNPSASNFTRFWGAGTTIQRGVSGALATIETGMSGNPISMLPFRPPLSGQSWMYMADSNKMRKASATSAINAIGLPKPGVPTTAINTTYVNSLITFNAVDGTNAAAWSHVAGRADDDSAGSAGPTITDAADGGVTFAANPGPIGAGIGYWSAMSTPKVGDWSTFNAGAVAASDDDEVQVTIAIQDPSLVDEIRIYIIISADYNSSTVPGTPGSYGLYNSDSYMRAIRPNDFSPWVNTPSNTAEIVGEAYRTKQLISQFPLQNSIFKQITGQTLTEALSPGIDKQAAILQSTQMPAGSQSPANFGTIDLPLRRGEFTRIGSTAGVGWNTITGVFITVHMNTNASTNIEFKNLKLTGGAGLDSANPGNIQYDYRVTNYDPATGAESNPSNVQATTAFLDSNRQPITVTPPASGTPSFRQRIYRRGGTLTNDWFFCGTNTSDGGIFVDGIDFTVTPAIATNSDATIEAAGAVEIDNDQPVTTQDANGNAVFNQPIRQIWGPVAGMIMGCGDPFRPGMVYWSKPGQPDSWPAANFVEVCAPSEELMNGGVFGGQAFVFSRERGYLLSTNLAGVADTIVATPTDCTPGMATYWGMCIGPDGIYYVAKDGVRVTKGGESMIVSDPLRPLFNGQTKNGLLPIDFTAWQFIRLTAHNNDIWFIYKDTGGTAKIMVYSTIYKFWRQVDFADDPIVVYSETGFFDIGQQLIMGGPSATAYVHSGTTDGGTAIQCQVRTGALDFNNARGDTMFGDVTVVANTGGNNLTLTTFLNDETVANTSQLAIGSAGTKRYLFDPYGTSGAAPQKARNLSLDLQWQGTNGISPVIERVVATMIPQPNQTMNRVTSWDTPGEAESYLMGVWIDADTGTSPRTIHVEYDLNGVISEVTGSPFTVNPSGLAGRHKWWFSWPVAKANMIRIRPDDVCLPWELYSYRWIQQAEPPRIAVWDSNRENKVNAYATGLNLEVDTFGLNKTIAMQIDGVTVSTQTVNSNGRKLVQLAFTPVRGSIFQFVATDANPGLLYSWQWMTDPEPGTQSNWNQNYTVAGTLADKYLKGALLEVDTFNVAKTVTFEVDGVVIDTESITANGRQVVEVSFPQALGRVFRMIPTDSNPGRLYSMEWIFDEEPLGLSRWETQELDFDISGWKTMPASWVTLKSTQTVNYSIVVYGQSGTAMTTLTGTIPSTAGLKQKVYVPFAANKGMLYKFVFTSSAKFWLYREESLCYVQAWGSQQPAAAKPFGNDDLDLVRGMHHANLVAGKSGGGQG